MWADLGECCIGASGEGCTIGAYLRDRERCKRAVGSRHAWWAVRELVCRCSGCGNRGSAEFASIRCRRQVNVAVSIDLEHDAIPRSGYRGSDFVQWHRAGVAAWLGLPDRSLRVSGPRVNDAHTDVIDQAYGPSLRRQRVGSGDGRGVYPMGLPRSEPIWRLISQQCMAR
jgi:hypothetical protein